MSFPNKWNQFVAPPTTTSKKAANFRRNYWKYAKRQKGNNNAPDQQRPRTTTIGPLWNGCISVRNQHIETNLNLRRQQRTDNSLVPTIVKETHTKSKYLARLNNDLKELWQIETPLYNMYAPSTSIPSFSVNLSGSLFANQKITNNPEIHEQEHSNLHDESEPNSPYSSATTPPQNSGQNSPSPNYFNTFSHASPTFVISSITDISENRQESNQLSSIKNQPVSIPPQLTFYENICLAVDSVCEVSINKLYNEDRTTMESILKRFRQEKPIGRLNESDWPFSPMTNHDTIGHIISPEGTYGSILHNDESNDDAHHHELEDSSASVEDRLF